MEKKTLVIIHPVSEAIGTLINTLSSDPTIEIQEVSDLKEAEQLLNFSAPAMVITSDATKCVTILATCKTLIKNTRSKVILTGKKVLAPKVSKKLDSLGLTSYIVEPITTKSLHYKVNFILKSLPIKSVLTNENEEKNRSLTIKTGEGQAKEDDDNQSDLTLKKIGTEVDASDKGSELNLSLSQDLSEQLSDAELQVKSKNSTTLDLINDDSTTGENNNSILTPFNFTEEDSQKKASPMAELFDDGSSTNNKALDLKLELEPDLSPKNSKNTHLDLATDSLKSSSSLDLKLDFEEENKLNSTQSATELDYTKKKSNDIKLDLNPDELVKSKNSPLFDMSEMEELKQKLNEPLIENDATKKSSKNINLNLEEDDFYKKKKQEEGESIDYSEFETEKKEETLAFEKKKKIHLDIENEEESLAEVEIEAETIKRKKKKNDLDIEASDPAIEKMEAAPGEEFAREKRVDLTLEEESTKEKDINLELAPEETEQKKDTIQTEKSSRQKDAAVNLEIAEETAATKKAEASEEETPKENVDTVLPIEADPEKETASENLDLTSGSTEKDDESLLQADNSSESQENENQNSQSEDFNKHKNDRELELIGDIEETKSKEFEDDDGLINSDNNVLDLNRKTREPDKSKAADTFNSNNNTSSLIQMDKPKIDMEFLTNPEIFNPKNVGNLNSNNILAQNKDIFNPSSTDNAPIIRTHANNKELQKLLKKDQSVFSLDDLKPIDDISPIDDYYEIYPDVYSPNSNGLEFLVILLEKIMNKNAGTLKILTAVSQIIYKTKMGVTSFFYLDINFNGASNLLINHTNPQFAPHHMNEEAWIQFREFNLPRYKKTIYPTILNRKLNTLDNEFVYPIFDGNIQKGFAIISFHRLIKIEDIKFCEILLDSVKNLIICYLKKTDKMFDNLKSV